MLHAKTAAPSQAVLKQALLSLGEDAMLLEELDGFIAGLLVCPDLIKAGEWLPFVWGTDSGGEPAFRQPRPSEPRSRPRDGTPQRCRPGH